MESVFQHNREEIKASKDRFNQFFNEDLYGKFDDEENIILSRGGWQDDVVQLPKFFRFCIDYTLNKHWVGYSHSLGHDRVFESLDRLMNVDRGKKYNEDNFGVTLGNVATVGFVFRQLKEWHEDAEVLTLSPYYPPIVKSVNYYFKDMHFVPSLGTEDEIKEEIERRVKDRPKLKILLLSNCVGIEGRIFSKEFWQSVCDLAEENGLFLVIDEGMWFDRLEYPDAIHNERTVRIITTSKKHGMPGMKTGLMVGPSNFMVQYYEQASTNYGGPASMCFLLAEFLFQFEYSHSTGDTESINRLAKRYGVPEEQLLSFYEDFVQTVAHNRNTFESNRAVLLAWLDKNLGLFKSAHVFQGINILMEPASQQKGYNLFLDLIQKHKVSVMPSACLGDGQDRMFRVTILEEQEKIRQGLARISDYLSS